MKEQKVKAKIELTLSLETYDSFAFLAGKHNRSGEQEIIRAINLYLSLAEYEENGCEFRIFQPGEHDIPFKIAKTDEFKEDKDGRRWNAFKRKWE